VSKVRTGAYIKMKELLGDNIALLTLLRLTLIFDDLFGNN